MDRNNTEWANIRACITSLSARRAWIEMSGINCKAAETAVALRKESVDRNFNAVQIIIVVVVALRKESVDRNLTVRKFEERGKKSLSARRAWIEITRYGFVGTAC